MHSTMNYSLISYFFGHICTLGKEMRLDGWGRRAGLGARPWQGASLPFPPWPCRHSSGLRVTGKSLRALQSGGWAHSRTVLQTFLGFCVCHVLSERPGSSKHAEKTWAAGLFYLRESQSTRHKLSSPRFLTHTRSPEPTLAMAGGSAGTDGGGTATRPAWGLPALCNLLHRCGGWHVDPKCFLKKKSIFRVSRISHFAFPSNLPGPVLYKELFTFISLPLDKCPQTVL